MGKTRTRIKWLIAMAAMLLAFGGGGQVYAAESRLMQVSVEPENDFLYKVRGSS